MTESYSFEAEQSVLGAILIAPDESIPLASALIESDFYLPEHQKTFNAMLDMNKQGKRIDFVTLQEYLKNEDTGIKNLKDYLLHLAQVVPSLANTGAYVSIVKSQSLKRRVMGKLQDIVYGDPDPDTIVPVLSKIVEEEQNGSATVNSDEVQKQDLINYNADIYRPLDPESRIWTGYSKIDKQLGGLLKGGVSCLGAPPSTGKTAIALNIAANQLKSKNRVAFFSLEMSKPQIYDRLFSSMLRIPYAAFTSKTLVVAQQHEVSEAVGKLYDRKQFYVFDSIYTLEEISSKIYELKPDLVIVDYIQRVRTAQKINDTREKINYVSAEFKRLGSRNKCHIMILSQVSRQKDKDTGKPKPPRMSDLKESGNIEEDSDYILMLFRPYVYEKSKEYTPEQAALLLDKNKYGQTGTTEMIFRGGIQRFEEVETRY